MNWSTDMNAAPRGKTEQAQHPLKKAFNDLRSGLSLKLLTWAMDVAPEEEKMPIAVFIRGHIERMTRTDPRLDKIKDEYFGGKP